MSAVCESTYLEIEKQKIMDGKYDGYIKKWAVWAYCRLPKESASSVEDLSQELWMDAIDALDRYDDSRGATFSTFLYRHLRLRASSKSRAAWGKNKCPFPRRTLPIILGYDIDVLHDDDSILMEKDWQRLSQRSKDVANALLNGSRISDMVEAIGNPKEMYRYAKQCRGINPLDLKFFIDEVREVFSNVRSLC